MALTVGEGDERPYLRLKPAHYTFTVGRGQFLAGYANDERLFHLMRNGGRIHFFDPENWPRASTNPASMPTDHLLAGNATWLSVWG